MNGNPSGSTGMPSDLGILERINLLEQLGRPVTEQELAEQNIAKLKASFKRNVDNLFHTGRRVIVDQAISEDIGVGIYLDAESLDAEGKVAQSLSRDFERRHDALLRVGMNPGKTNVAVMKLSRLVRDGNGILRPKAIPEETTIYVARSANRDIVVYTTTPRYDRTEVEIHTAEGFRDGDETYLAAFGAFSYAMEHKDRATRS